MSSAAMRVRQMVITLMTVRKFVKKQLDGMLLRSGFMIAMLYCWKSTHKHKTLTGLAGGIFIG